MATYGHSDVRISKSGLREVSSNLPPNAAKAHTSNIDVDLAVWNCMEASKLEDTLGTLFMASC